MSAAATPRIAANAATSAALSTSGAVTATQLYGPYGAVRYSNGALPGTLGYTGQRADALTGLDYYNARYYDPVAGQFTSADTTLRGGLNRYAYVGGNPETRADPTGRMYTKNTHPSYVDSHGVDHYEQAMYQLFLQDGTAADGSPLAAYMALNDPSAYAAALAWSENHGGVGVPNVGKDAYLLIGSKSSAYWNRHGGDFVRLNAFKAQFAMQQTGGDGQGDAFRLMPTTPGELSAIDALTEGDAAVAAESDTVATDDAALGGCSGLSFSADTRVATPSGERPIASLQIGDHVLAYDPATGRMKTQTIVKVFLNHDHDRLDVTLALPAARTATPATPATHPTTDAETARERARAVAGHGLRAPPDAPASATSSAASAVTQEIIHTTANHPWLSADHGWLLAGDLQVGEPVRLLDGGTATVVALRTLPGVGPMWDLSLDDVHTFAVGATQAVVHNCPYADGPQVPATKDELNQGADAIKNHGPYVRNYSSDYQWDFHHAEGPDPDRNPNAPGHDPAYSMRYYFYFDDAGTSDSAIVSANFNPVTRDWETGQFHYSTDDIWH